MAETDPVHEFAQSYEFRADDGDYTPAAHERAMIEDAIHGYLGVLRDRDDFREAARDQIIAAPDSEKLREAARAVIDSAFDFYKARNGRVMSIEGDDGEKCWIVPFDQFEDLRAALGASS